MLQVDDAQPRAGRLGEPEVDALELLRRLLDGDILEPLDLLLLGLGARGHRGLGAEAVHELLEVGDLALLVLEARRLLLLAGLLLVEIVVVVAGVAVEGAACLLYTSRCV